MKKLMLSGLMAGQLLAHGAFALTFDSSVSRRERALIQSDFNQINRLNWHSVHASKAGKNLRKIFGMKQLDNSSILNWLNERVKIIIHMPMDRLESRMELLAEDVEYPSFNSSSFSDSGSLVTIMSNTGGALYVAGKELRQKIGVRINSEIIEVNSPRVGIVAIEEGLFSKGQSLNSQGSENSFALSNALARLQTYYHEGRHSDGNGASLGFFHRECPSDHEYAGNYACDGSANGPYSIGAHFMKVAIKACEDQCSLGQKVILKLMAADSFSRITLDKDSNPGQTEHSYYLDASPEYLE